MVRFTALLIVLAMTASVLMSCAGGNSISPDLDTTADKRINASASPTNLWGLYEISIDTETMEVTSVPLRTPQYNTNVVTFLNNKPANLSFKMNGVTPGPGYSDVNLDVSITHPIAGQAGFRGYDVRGILIGNGSSTLPYDTTLKYPKIGTDQILINADGYTRWFNPGEFTSPGLFGYLKGIYASNFTPTSNINGYKYFADNLLAGADLWSFLLSTADNGVFGSGVKNTRNYQIRFPSSTGIKFAYAVVAGWKGATPDKHPGNSVESPQIFATVTPDVWYKGPGDFGGMLKTDISVFDWNASLSGGIMMAYTIKIDSTVLSSTYTANMFEMTPTASGSGYYTYHIEIPATNVTSATGNEMWVIIEYAGQTYSNPFGVPNGTGGDSIATYMRFPVPTTDPPTPTVYEVQNSGFTFSPKNIDVPVGGTVTWTITSGKHTVTKDSTNQYPGGPDSSTQYKDGEMKTGEKYSWVVPNVPKGTVFYYHCIPHGTQGNGSGYGSGMVGSVTVI